MTQTFIFYESFKRQLDELKNADRLRFYDAIAAYGIDGAEPDFTGIAKALWLQFKFVIDETTARREAKQENGRRGGRTAKGGNADNAPVHAPESVDAAGEESPYYIEENRNAAESNTKQPEADESKAKQAEATQSKRKQSEATQSKTKQAEANESKAKLNVNVNGNVNVNRDIPPDSGGMTPLKQPDSDNRHSPTDGAACGAQDNPHASPIAPPPDTQAHSPNLPAGSKEAPTLDTGAAEQPPEKTSAHAMESVDAESMRLAELLYSLHQAHDSRFKKKPEHIRQWAADIEKLCRIDGRTAKEVERVIRWVKTAGNFWLPNIISGSKLREKFPQVFAQMTQAQARQERPNGKERGGAWERDRISEAESAQYLEIL